MVAEVPVSVSPVMAEPARLNMPPATGSTYSGLIGTISFVCGQSGSLALLHGTGNTDTGRTTVSQPSSAPVSRTDDGMNAAFKPDWK